MSSVNVYNCQRCFAPLEIPPGSRTIVCRYCGTHNDLQRPSPPQATPPRAAAPAQGKLIAILVGLVAIAALGALLLLRGVGSLRALTGPLELEWTDERKFVVKSDESLYGEVSIYEANYQITFHGFPKGTKWKVDEKSGRIDSNIYDIIKLQNVEGEFRKIPVAKYQDYVLGPKGKLQIELPSGQTASIELRQVDAWMSILKVLNGIENGPVLFDGELKKDGGPRNVALLETASMKLFGPAAVLEDIDQLAITRRLAEVKGRKLCSGYKRDGKPIPDFTLLLKETEAVVFDRRTGAITQRKVFPPDDHCPMFNFALGGRYDQEKDSYAPSENIASWLRSLVER